MAWLLCGPGARLEPFSEHCSAGIVHLQRTDMPFAERQIFGGGVSCFVFASPKSKKFLVGFLGEPIISSEIHTGPRHVLEQSSSSMVWIAAEQGIPVTTGAIDLYKTSFASRLDFELPQD